MDKDVWSLWRMVTERFSWYWELSRWSSLKSLRKQVRGTSPIETSDFESGGVNIWQIPRSRCMIWSSSTFSMVECVLVCKNALMPWKGRNYNIDILQDSDNMSLSISLIWKKAWERIVQGVYLLIFVVSLHDLEDGGLGLTRLPKRIIWRYSWWKKSLSKNSESQRHHFGIVLHGEPRGHHVCHRRIVEY